MQEITPTAASTDFRSNLMSDGPNPLVKYPALRQIEVQLRDYVMQPTPDMKTDYLIAVGAPEIGAAHVRQSVSELNQGADALIAQRYGAPSAPNGSCGVEPTAELPFRPVEQAIKPVDWMFLSGACVDGKANGIASVRSADGVQHFTGQFVDGRAVDGIYQDTAQNLLYVGPISQSGEPVRASLRHQWPGKSVVYYIGDLQGGLANGKGVSVSPSSVGGLHLNTAGQFAATKLNGFGTYQSLMNFGDGGRKVGAWIGSWADGKAHGLAGNTNDADSLFVGTYEHGQGNGVGGMYYADLTPLSTYRAFRFGGYRGGKRDGGHLIQNAWSGMEAREVWRNGLMIEDDTFDFGQIFALAGGAAVLGMSNIPAAAKVQMGGAYTADVMGNTGGSNTINTANALAGGAAAGRPGMIGGRPVSSSVAPAGAMRTESYSFTCAHSGSHTIQIPYRDASKLPIKKAYTKTMACNETDNWSKALADCNRAFGNQSCQEQ
ncbi:hypothetical protein ACFSM5_19880 [Lacibacterium aquatile]|uniref:Uncharacterized protein n=1 Tax=Lacibacterium aquatile TaxID=1168082 RepID=A0ABW5DWQ3_9PROT